MQPNNTEGKKIGAVATVSILGQLEEVSYPCIMLQHRLNHKESHEFKGLWELPKGKIYAGEHLAKAAERELWEEAGLKISRWLTPRIIDGFHRVGSFSTHVASYQPYFCTQAQGTHNHLSLAVMVALRGKPKKTEEADGHTWFKMKDIIQLIRDHQVYPLDVPILIKWIGDAIKSASEKNKIMIYEMMATAGLKPRINALGRPTVCFDLGGVLIDHKHDLLIKHLSTIFKISARRLKTLLFGSGLLDRLNIGEVFPEQVLQFLSSRLGISISKSKFISTWELGIRIREENVKMLDSIRSAYPDMQFAAATNLDVIKHNFLMRHSLWYAELDYRHVSCLIRDRKPNVSFYLSLSKQLGCSTKDIFFIDDKRTNIESAKRAGLFTFTANRHNPLGNYFMNQLHRWIRERNKP